MTISEIQELADGMHVDRLQGKLTKVFQREDKVDKKDRPYTLQNGEVEENGNSIRISFWNHKDLTGYRGQVIVLRSVAPKSFISVSHYKGKAQLSVPAQAIVLGEKEDTDDIPMDYPEDYKKTAFQPNNQPQANVELKRPINEDGVLQARRFLMQCVNLRKLCDTAAHAAAGEIYEKDSVKDIATSFFITLEKAGYLSKMPNSKPLSKNEDKPEMAEKDEEF